MRGFISLLRGINVGSARRISKASLVKLYTSIDCLDPQVHLQSGNVIFDATATARVLADRIRSRFLSDHGYDVPVVILEPRQLRSILARNPFSQEAGRDPAKVLIGFPASAPKPAALRSLTARRFPPNQLVAGRTAIYLFCPEGFGRARLPDFEEELGVSITFRNIRVAQALLELTSKSP